MKTLFTALRAAVVAAGFVFLWASVAETLHRSCDRSLAFEWPAPFRPIGIVLMLVGGSLALACVSTFVIRGEGTPAPFDPPRKFVVVGPYKFVRNPMYIGAFTLLLGLGFYQGSPSILLFTLLWLLLDHLFVVLYEEPHLRSNFSAPYYDNIPS